MGLSCELSSKAVHRTAKVFLILMWTSLWQVNVPLINSSEASLDRDSLLPGLLELQRDYCGGVALCDDDDHVEPELGMFPTPCCVPCSCLPTCKTYENCCPTLNGSLATVDLGNETGIRAEDVTVTDEEELLHKDDSMSRNEVQNESNTTKEGAQIIKESMICVRPQIQREQNIYPDSQAYKMIGSCPTKLSRTTIDKECKKGFADVGFNNIVPVTSHTSNMTYVNKHCLNCNENKSFGNNKIYYWKPIITIQSWQYYPHFFTNPQDIVSFLLKYEYFNGMKTGNIHFLPPNPELVQPCEQYDVISCNQTGLWDNYNRTTEQLCQSGYSLPVIRRVNSKVSSFRNLACLYCNTPQNSFGKLPARKQMCAINTISKPVPRFNMTINVPNLDSVITEQNNSALISKQYIDDTTVMTMLKQSKVCPDGYIAILTTCREVLCPRDHYNKDGHCIPLYNVLSGISLNIKLEIMPSLKIAEADRLEFANTLKYLVNSSLEQMTSLHSRHLSLWYLPRSDMNQDEFYFLNMFLSGPNGVVKYDKSVKEIHDFYNDLKTKAKLKHKNGLDVTLQYKFGNRVLIGKSVTSLLGGVSLDLLLENGWRLKQAGPWMTISESNWCYRTVIMRNETEFVAKNVLMIKQANIQLFRDQFERNHLEYYICLDLLHASIDKTLNAPSTVLEKRPTTGRESDVTDDTPWFSNKITVMAIFILTMILLSIVFCKIKANRSKKDLRHFISGVKTADTITMGSYDDINFRETRHSCTAHLNNIVESCIDETQDNDKEVSNCDAEDITLSEKHQTETNVQDNVSGAKKEQLDTTEVNSDTLEDDLNKQTHDKELESN